MTLIGSDVLQLLSELVVRGTGASFRGADFRNMSGPGVYLFLKSGLPLYVGSSNAALSRAAQRNHRQEIRARRDCDQVLLYPCRDQVAAKVLEKVLIRNLKPQYNKTHKGELPDRGLR